MHSSRMRTICSSSHLLAGVPGPGGTWSWGVVYLVQGMYLVPGGCTWSGDGCTWSGGCTWSQGGVPGLGGVPGPRGVYLVPGGCTWSGGTCPGTPPCGQTHMCKNITFATLLQTVIKSNVIFVTYLVWCGGKGWL